MAYSTLVTHEAFREGALYGRNGKGNIFVTAAGNGGPDDSCSFDGFLNSIYTFMVSGASSVKVLLILNECKSNYALYHN